MAEASGGIGTRGRTRFDPIGTISPPTRSTAPISTTAFFGVVPVVSRSMTRKRVGLSEWLAIPYLGAIPRTDLPWIGPVRGPRYDVCGSRGPVPGGKGGG